MRKMACGTQVIFTVCSRSKVGLEYFRVFQSSILEWVDSAIEVIVARRFPSFGMSSLPM